MAHGFAGAGDVAVDRTGKTRDSGAFGAARDLGYGFEITLGSDREAGLDDIDAHRVEKVGDFELGLEGHGSAGALLAVAQRGVKN